MYLRKYSILLLLTIPVLSVPGQFNTYSPYTRFGLGDLARAGFAQNLAMGGTGIAIHEPNRINYLNPAAFAALDSTSVYFDFGANSFHNRYTTSEANNTWWNMNLHHVAFASSLGKYLGFSAGIVPYSSIGYNIKQEYNDFNTGEAMDTYNKGDGGIMNFYAGASVKFFNRVSLGATMNYLLGRLTREREIEFPVNQTYSRVSAVEEFDFRHPVFELGVQYREVFGDKFFFTLGGVYGLQSDIGANLKYRVENYFYRYGSAGGALNDSTEIEPIFVVEQDTIASGFKIPQKTGIGISLGIPDKLIVTGDYYMQDWSGTLSGENYTLADASSMHFGIEWTPDREALRGYHKLMTYRVGGYYSNYYLQVHGHQLQDYGITFGAGLPVRTLRSTANVSFTLGTRGTTEYNLIKENYGIITFNVTLHDLWFRKRRFD